jgi:6-pyruvoyltetrahydropterin/6-carboxytetrahydropterin synthase
MIPTPGGIGYVLPKEHVVALPIDNSSAERLAEWFSGRLWSSLENKVTAGLESLTVEVWEGPGQRGSYQIERLPLV